MTNLPPDESGSPPPSRSGPPGGASGAPPVRSGGPPGAHDSPLQWGGGGLPAAAGAPPPTKDEGIVLCLSGGGFRATFFHLGVLRYLSRVDELKRVAAIFAVSGGSILAAHLAQRWDDYSDPKRFETAADELRMFAESDVRGRIVRTWLLAGTWFGLPLFISRLRRDQLLVREYERLFERQGRDTELKALSPLRGPQIHLLATSFTTGQLCAFSADGFVRFGDRPDQALKSHRFTIPLAVAASSAFPPLFPPLRIDADRFRLDVRTFGVAVDYLTDGGVFDNLGIRAAMARFLTSGVLSGAEILVSDASASFTWKTRPRFSNIIGRTRRATDVLMRRVADLEIAFEMLAVSAAQLAVSQRKLELEHERLAGELDPRVRVPRITVLRIDGSRDDTSYRSLRLETRSGFEGFRSRLLGIQGATPEIREPWAVAMSSVRTDLDTFSKDERSFLEMWGYEQASAAWSPPAGFGVGGLPGSRPAKLGEPPTRAELVALELSAGTGWGLIAPRDAVGKALLGTWLLIIAIGVSVVWYLAR